MTAQSTKDLKIDMVDSTTPSLSLTANGVTKGNPTIVSVVDATGVQVGDIMRFGSDSTGFPELDGLDWVVGGVSANDITVIGLDTTSSGSTFAAGSPIEVYQSPDMVRLCWSDFTSNAGSASSVSVATYCDPTASIPSQVVEAGTYDFSGYIDKDEAGYVALQAAYKSGRNVVFRVMMPKDGLEAGNGYLIFSGVIASFPLSFPIDGAQEYSGEITLTREPEHLF